MQDSTAGNLDESTVSGRREPPESSGRYFSNPGGCRTVWQGRAETTKLTEMNVETKIRRPKSQDIIFGRDVVNLGPTQPSSCPWLTTTTTTSGDCLLSRYRILLGCDYTIYSSKRQTFIDYQ